MTFLNAGREKKYKDRNREFEKKKGTQIIEPKNRETKI